PESGKQAAAKIYQYFEGLLAARGKDDADDLLSLLLAAAQRAEISHVEILGNRAYQLSRNPDQRAILLERPSLIPNAIEEVFRFDSPTHMMARTLTRDVTLHGRTMEKGRKV